MSVTSATPDKAGISGLAEGGKGGKSTKKGYSLSYFVVTSALTDQSPAILDYFRRTSGLPWIGDRLNVLGSRDNDVECTRIEPKREGPTHWRVAVAWQSPDQEETRPSNDGSGNETNDPFDWSDEVSVTFSKIQVPVYKARHRGGLQGVANGIEMTPANSATVPFNPPLMRDLAVRVVRISKIRNNYDGVANGSWIDVVNNDLVQVNKPRQRFSDTWQPFTAKVENWGGTFQIINKRPCWKVDLEVHVHPISWRDEVPDRGLHRRANPGDADGYGGNFGALLQSQVPVARITDKQGHPISEEVLLFGNGQPIPPNHPPVYITWQKYEERAFNGAINF